MPSLSQVKNFKLPGVTHPIQVSIQVRIVCDCNTVIIILLWIHFMQCLTTKGVPFYMNNQLCKDVFGTHTSLKQFSVIQSYLLGHIGMLVWSYIVYMY